MAKRQPKITVESPGIRTLPPADPAVTSTTMDKPTKESTRQVIAAALMRDLQKEGYGNFESLAKRLVSVPKKEIDAQRETKRKRT